MECPNSVYAAEVLNLTQFKDKPNFHNAHAVMLWYQKLGMHTFKYPSLHKWQLELSVKIHLDCQDVFGIVATGAGKSTLIHLPVVADMALGCKTISLVTVPTKALSTAHVCQIPNTIIRLCFQSLSGFKCTEVWYICSSHQ